MYTAFNIFILPILIVLAYLMWVLVFLVEVIVVLFIRVFIIWALITRVLVILVLAILVLVIPVLVFLILVYLALVILVWIIYVWVILVIVILGRVILALVILVIRQNLCKSLFNWFNYCFEGVEWSTSRKELRLQVQHPPLVPGQLGHHQRPGVGPERIRNSLGGFLKQSSGWFDPSGCSCPGREVELLVGLWLLQQDEEVSAASPGLDRKYWLQRMRFSPSG